MVYYPNDKTKRHDLMEKDRSRISTTQLESSLNPLEKVKINRNVKVQTHRFDEFFKGFKEIKAVKEIFGKETEKVLNELRVEFISRRGYMGVSDLDGHIIISAEYLRHGDLRDIYLDIIHELVHVRQFREGRQLFDRRYGYTDRPTEIEAYRYAVEEAKRIGMTEEEILRYLKTEWMSEENHRKLAETLDVKTNKQQKSIP
jgi:hypothetical protein